MIIPDKKKVAGIILQGMDGAMSKPVLPEQEIDSSDEQMRLIAEDILTAIDNRSSLELARAIRALMELDEEKDEEEHEEMMEELSKE